MLDSLPEINDRGSQVDNVLTFRALFSRFSCSKHDADKSSHAALATNSKLFPHPSPSMNLPYQGRYLEGP